VPALPRASPVLASVGGLSHRERPLHAAFRRPSIQPKRPDKMMAGAAGPSAAGRWARSALPAPQAAGRVRFDARGVVHGLEAR
jgi:hypothetical protein